jgi:hypothetical protein
MPTCTSVTATPRRFGALALPANRAYHTAVFKHIDHRSSTMRPSAAAKTPLSITMTASPATTYINVLVTGGSGLGKTSRVRDLAATLTPDFSFETEPSTPQVTTTDLVSPVKPVITTLPAVAATKAARSLQYTFLVKPCSVPLLCIMF